MTMSLPLGEPFFHQGLVLKFEVTSKLSKDYKYYIQMTNFHMHIFAWKCFSTLILWPHSLFLKLEHMFQNPYV